MLQGSCGTSTRVTSCYIHKQGQGCCTFFLLRKRAARPVLAAHTQELSKGHADQVIQDMQPQLPMLTPSCIVERGSYNEGYGVRVAHACHRVRRNNIHAPPSLYSSAAFWWAAESYLSFGGVGLGMTAPKLRPALIFLVMPCTVHKGANSIARRMR